MSISDGSGGPAHPSSERAGETVLIRLREIVPRLRPSERRIANQFLTNPAEAAELSVAELAERGDTSTTTVIRFCRRMGYQHLRHLRIDVLHEVARETFATSSLGEVSGDIDRGDSLEDVVAKVSLAETLSIADTATAFPIGELRRAVAAIEGADRVSIFGVGASSIVGHDLQQKLTRIGRMAVSWSDSHTAWTAAATLKPTSVAVAISHSGGTSDTIDFLAIAAQAGATTIAITNHAGSPITETSDIVLTTAARETKFRSGALGSRIAQLMVVDCLFIGVAQMSYDESMAALRGTFAVVNARRPKNTHGSDEPPPPTTHR